jgi:hypothetical protein
MLFKLSNNQRMKIFTAVCSLYLPDLLIPWYISPLSKNPLCLCNIEQYAFIHIKNVFFEDPVMTGVIFSCYFSAESMSAVASCQQHSEAINSSIKNQCSSHYNFVTLLFFLYYHPQ